MKDMKVILYYADWCGHCVKFKSIWKYISEILSKKNIANEKINADSLSAEQKKELKGIPTIMIESDGKKTVYEGPMDVEDEETDKAKAVVIVKYLIGDGKKYVLTGGMSRFMSEPTRVDYKKKYLKYKKKYLELKKKLFIN